VITFKWVSVATEEAVVLDGKRVGVIKRIECQDGKFCGWQYFPKGQKEGGEKFKKLSECEESLLW